MTETRSGTSSVSSHDSALGESVLLLLEELQERRLELWSSVETLEQTIVQVSDEELRGDLDRAWWALEALLERMEEASAEDERSDPAPTVRELEVLDRVARRMREVLALVGVERVPVWKLHRCRICGADQGTFLPWGAAGTEPSHLWCSCCGGEFGVDDRTSERARAHRNEWLAGGARWWDRDEEPSEWDAREQLRALPSEWTGPVPETEDPDEQ